MNTGPKCDPCVLCANYYEDWRDYRDTGMVDCGCSVPDVSGDWQPEDGVPCPGYRPFLASDGLMEQLWEEEEYRQYLEDEKSRCEDY